MKIKIYLDTNTVIDFFINQAKAIKGKKEFEMPRKLEFFADNLDKMNFATSIITQAEIIREMVSGYGLTDREINELWEKFIKLLNCGFIPKVEIDQRFVELPLKIKMRMRTLMNFQHLFIAMKENMHIVTGDKELIKIVRGNKIYDKILSYIELRKLISFSSLNL